MKLCETVVVAELFLHCNITTLLTVCSLFRVWCWSQ